MPFGISQNELARLIGVPPRRINEIVLGKRSITPETAVLLEEVLGTTPEMWMRLQCAYDIARARQRLNGRRVLRPRPWSREELPASPIDPEPSPIDEFLDDHPIVRLGLERAKAKKGELWRTRRRKERVEAERERVYWMQKWSLDAADPDESAPRWVPASLRGIADRPAQDAGVAGDHDDPGNDDREDDDPEDACMGP